MGQRGNAGESWSGIVIGERLSAIKKHKEPGHGLRSEKLLLLYPEARGKSRRYKR